jgi:O-antigen/teichoic acid export membrane protein
LEEGAAAQFASTIVAAFVCICLGILGIGSVVLWVGKDAAAPSLVGATIVLICAQAGLELLLEAARAKSRPKVYVVAATLRAALGLLFALSFVYAGWGAVGPLLGNAASCLVVLAAAAVRGIFADVRYSAVDWNLMRRFFAYGFPFTIAYSLNCVTGLSDRLIIAWLLGAAEAARYAAAYDLASQTVIMIMAIAYLPAQPIIVSVFERQGEAAARAELRRYAVLLVGIAVPVVAATAIFSNIIAAIALGESFRAGAAIIMVCVAIGSFLEGIRAFYLDFAFQLRRMTGPIVWISASASMLNVLANMVLIPSLGLVGAALSKVLAAAIVVLASWSAGRRHLRVPCLVTTNTAKLGLASAGFLAAGPVIERGEGLGYVLAGAAAASFGYIACLVSLSYLIPGPPLGQEFTRGKAEGALTPVKAVFTRLVFRSKLDRK